MEVMKWLYCNSFLTVEFSIGQQEEEAAAQVYEEFVASFEDQGKSLNKAWVKGGVVNPASRSGKIFACNIIPVP